LGVRGDHLRIRPDFWKRICKKVQLGCGFRGHCVPVCLVWLGVLQWVCRACAGVFRQFHQLDLKCSYYWGAGRITRAAIKITNNPRWFVSAGDVFGLRNV
jgi:hypothetical protein